MDLKEREDEESDSSSSDENAIADDIDELITQEKANALEYATNILNSANVPMEDKAVKRIEFPTTTGSKDAYMCGEPESTPRGLIVLHQKSDITDALKGINI